MYGYEELDNTCFYATLHDYIGFVNELYKENKQFILLEDVKDKQVVIDKMYQCYKVLKLKEWDNFNLQKYDEEDLKFFIYEYSCFQIMIDIKTIAKSISKWKNKKTIKNTNELKLITQVITSSLLVLDNLFNKQYANISISKDNYDNNIENMFVSSMSKVLSFFNYKEIFNLLFKQLLKLDCKFDFNKLTNNNKPLVRLMFNCLETICSYRRVFWDYLNKEKFDLENIKFSESNGSLLSEFEEQYIIDNHEKMKEIW